VAHCIFCAIVAGDAPAAIVDEDAATVSFMDIRPLARGHALVVPRRHYVDLLEIDGDDLTSTFAAARRLAARIKDRLGAEGVAVVNSCGEAAGQVVMHFHIHVLPMNGEPPPFPRSQRPLDGAERTAVAAALRGG
jgi:histidine triad (HIT) family protein